MSAATVTHRKSPLTDEWWIWRLDGKPVVDDMILCNGGIGDAPDWPPWCEETEDTQYVAERYRRPAARQWPNRYLREVVYYLKENYDKPKTVHSKRGR